MEPAVGTGVYSVVEASRLTSVAAPRIRRWFGGYEFRARGNARRMPPVVTGDSREVDGHMQLTFLDLIEVRLIEKFLAYGVTWKELRRAAHAGSELLRTAHPFASLRFRTDGRRIFADQRDNSSDDRLIQLRDQQMVFRKVIEPALLGVEFDSRQAVRWWPMGEKRGVVIDPLRAFGKPIAARCGIPAAILAAHAARNGIANTARWYDVDPAEVRGAESFAKRFAA